MAYPVAAAVRQHFENATTATIDLSGLGIVSGDLVVIPLSQDGGTTAISESTAYGWTVRNPSNANGDARMAVAYKYSSGSESNPTFTGTATEAWSTLPIVIKDADPTNYVCGYASNTFTSNPAASPALTTVDADDEYGPILLLYAWCFDGTATMTRVPTNDLIELGKDSGDFYDQITDATIASTIGYRLQVTAGAVPSISAYGTSASEGGNAWVLAIKNKSGGMTAPDCRSGVSELRWYGNFGAAHQTTTWDAPSNFTASTINAIATDTTLATVGNGYYTTTTTWGTSTYLEGLTAVEEWVGGSHVITSNNMSGKVFSIQWGINGNSTNAKIGAEGVIVGFSDGANWVVYQLATKALLGPANLQIVNHIALGNATIYDASDGTGDAMVWTAITRVMYAYHRLAVAGDMFFSIKNASLHGPSILTGGGSSRPVKMRDLEPCLEGWGFLSLVDKQGTNQIIGKNSVQIGDGATQTYFKAAAASFEFPEEYSSTGQYTWNADPNSVEVVVKASASDTISLAAGVVATDTPQVFKFDAASSGSASYPATGFTLVGFDVTLDTDIPLSGATFSGGSEIVGAAADLTNCVIEATTSTDAAYAVDANGAVLDGCTIDGTGAAYAIELGTAVTAITLTDCTITAGTMDKVHVLKTLTTVSDGSFVVGIHYRINTAGTTNWTAIGGAPGTVGTNFTATGVGGAGTGTADQAVKITISGMTSLVETDVTTAGAPAWIAAPQPTLDATVLSGTRVVLYNNTTAAELDNTAPAGTAWSKVITGGASSNDNLTLFAFKEGYAEFSTSFLYSGSDTTILVTQVVDDVVAAFRTEDSVTDYTTLTEYNIYAPTIYIQADDADGVSKISRLATYYNGVLTTEDGARYFRGGMSMLSTGAVRVNKSVIELLLENVSATKSLRFSDEATRRLYTDDGTSIIAPSSVAGSIEYAYGGVPDTVETGVSGLTGPESAQLMGLPSAATIVATAVDGTTTLAESLRLANAVLGGKVSGAGSGTESFRDLADTKNRVVATVDSSGNRTAITRDLT